MRADVLRRRRCFGCLCHDFDGSNWVAFLVPSVCCVTRWRIVKGTNAWECFQINPAANKKLLELLFMHVLGSFQGTFSALAITWLEGSEHSVTATLQVLASVVLSFRYCGR